MGWIGCVPCEKFRRDFVAQTFALVRPVLHRVSEGKKMVPSARKWYEMHQNVSLRSNGVDRARLLRKIPKRLRGTNFCTSSARFAPSFVWQPNSPECTQMVRNAPKHQLRVQWGGLGAFLEENSDATSCTNFCTSSARFAPSFVRQPNGPKRTQMVRNAQKRQFKVKCGGSGAFVAKNSEATSWHELLH